MDNQAVVDNGSHAAPEESLNVWLALIIAPLLLLVMVAMAQVIVRFSISRTAGLAGTTSGAKLVINIVSLLLGVVAVITLLLIPLWITLFMKSRKRNLQNGYGLHKNIAMIAAVFGSFWSWLYTYEHDKSKFWAGLCICFLSGGYLGIFVWIWAILDNAIKPDSFFAQYSLQEPAQKG